MYALNLNLGYAAGEFWEIYFNYVHLDIINGKVWIQRDGTEDGVGYALEAAGIPKEDIVPSFHPKTSEYTRVKLSPEFARSV